MKKTLSIIMSICMILSVCFFSVSAAEATVGSVAADYKPEGTAITDAAGFAAMYAIKNRCPLPHVPAVELRQRMKEYL